MKSVRSFSDRSSRLTLDSPCSKTLILNMILMRCMMGFLFASISILIPLVARSKSLDDRGDSDLDFSAMASLCARDESDSISNEVGLSHNYWLDQRYE
jgi:hypothetical protein